MSDRPIIGSRLDQDVSPSPQVLAGDAAPRRPYLEIFDKLVESWQEHLRKSSEAQAFLRRRRLWEPAVLNRVKVGFVARPWYPPPASSTVRRMLYGMKILQESGRQIQHNRLVVPYFDRHGFLSGVYSQSIEETEPPVPPLYPPGDLFHVFNAEGIPSEGSLIVAGSILDALTLLVLGFENVTSAIGEDRLISVEVKHLVLERRVRRVVCVYPEWIPEFTLQWGARGLVKEGVEVFWVRVPATSLNSLVVAGMTRSQVGELLDSGVSVEAGRKEAGR